MADQPDMPLPVRETMLPPAACETVIVGDNPPDAVRETLLPAAVVDAAFGQANGEDAAPQPEPEAPEPEPETTEQPVTQPGDAGHEEESA